MLFPINTDNGGYAEIEDESENRNRGLIDENLWETQNQQIQLLQVSLCFFF